jgi:hypothetical protein
MKSAVVLLPGLNRDRDMIAALTKISGASAEDGLADRHRNPDVDLIVIPGGFSYRRLSALRRDRRALAGDARGRRQGRQGRHGDRRLQRLPDPRSRPACCRAR